MSEPTTDYATVDQVDELQKMIAGLSVPNPEVAPSTAGELP